MLVFLLSVGEVVHLGDKSFMQRSLLVKNCRAVCSALAGDEDRIKALLRPLLSDIGHCTANRDLKFFRDDYK